MLERSKNPFHKRVGAKAVRLDARALMDEVEKLPQQDAYNLSFRLIGDQLVASNLAPRSSSQGTFLVEMRWPSEKSGWARGVVWIVHEHLMRVEQILILTGEPTKAGGRIWKFTCELTNRQVQVVYLNLATERFISSYAIQKKLPPRRPRTRGLWRAWMKASEASQQLARGRTTEQGRGINKIFEASTELARLRFYYRENNLPEETALNVGFASLIPTLKRRRPRANPDWPYYRNKAGALRIKVKFKKRFGLLTRSSEKRGPLRKRHGHLKT